MSSTGSDLRSLDYAFTRSTKRATAIPDALESGMVGVNHPAISLPEAPFAAATESGHGHEDGTEGLDAYLITEFVTRVGG